MSTESSQEPSNYDADTSYLLVTESVPKLREIQILFRW